MKLRLIYGLLIIMCLPLQSLTQDRGDELGAWYMYFWNVDLDSTKFGLQGDLQWRNWDFGADLEQVLLRAGVTYDITPTAQLTLGYGGVHSDAYDAAEKLSWENRIYQELLLSQNITSWVRIKHRLRYEQRFVENQDFRTRYRYNLFVTIPLSKNHFAKNTAYLSLYNEVFVNGQRSIGSDRQVEIFDRNRVYGAIGYVVKKGLNVQVGVMNQYTENWAKTQMQLSLHSNF